MSNKAEIPYFSNGIPSGWEEVPPPSMPNDLLHPFRRKEARIPGMGPRVGEVMVGCPPIFYREKIDSQKE